MGAILGWRIPDANIKTQFEEVVQKKHHKKHTVCGEELQKAMVLYMKYGDAFVIDGENVVPKSNALSTDSHTHEPKKVEEVKSVEPEFEVETPEPEKLSTPKTSRKEKVEKSVGRKQKHTIYSMAGDLTNIAFEQKRYKIDYDGLSKFFLKFYGWDDQRTFNKKIEALETIGTLQRKDFSDSYVIVPALRKIKEEEFNAVVNANDGFNKIENSGF
jgi:hypothetical protein